MRARRSCVVTDVIRDGRPVVGYGFNSNGRYSPGALLRGRIERMHRSCLILTFGGGTNEIQRDIIGMVALGLPRVNR